MSQAPDINICQRSISMFGTIMVTGTIVFSIAGLQGATSPNAVIETFSQKGTNNYRTMSATKSRSITKSGSSYLMEEIKETNNEHGYLHFDQRELSSIINIKANYPTLEIMENDLQSGSNLPEISMYEILTNGSIINMRQCFMGSLTPNTAYTTLESPYSSIRTLDEIEVMAMTEQLKQLTQDLRDLDKKYDRKMDSFDKELDAKFDRLEAKIDTVFDKLTVIANKLSDKVGTINTDVVAIKTTMDVNNTWKEKLQIPLFVSLTVGLIVVIATAALRVFIP